MKGMTVVVDTNVLISGFLTSTGMAQSVFTLALKRHTVVLSEFVLNEFQDKLVNKLGVPAYQVKEATRFLRRRAVVLSVKNNPHLKFPDKDDVPVLSLVEAAGANYFITGDKQLLGLKKLGTALFLSPREAVEVL